VLRKKLFLSIARPSPGLRVDHHLLCHGILLWFHRFRARSR
jgi:hypothetical protein